MTIRLDLARHCIETAMKRRHNAAVSRYFRSPDHQRRDLEEEIAVLGHALESFDFSRLRSRWAALAGHRDVVVLLGLHGPSGQPALTVDNVLIVPPADPV